MTATEAVGNTKILYSIRSVCHLIEQKNTFSPLFLRGLFHVHKCRMDTSILMVNSENSCLLSALQKCIPSVDRTDNISSFDIMQTGLFYFNCAVSAPVEVIYSLQGISV